MVGIYGAWMKNMSLKNEEENFVGSLSDICIRSKLAVVSTFRLSFFLRLYIDFRDENVQIKKLVLLSILRTVYHQFNPHKDLF